MDTNGTISNVQCRLCATENDSEQKSPVENWKLYNRLQLIVYEFNRLVNILSIGLVSRCAMRTQAEIDVTRTIVVYVKFDFWLVRRRDGVSIDAPYR